MLLAFQTKLQNLESDADAHSANPQWQRQSKSRKTRLDPLRGGYLHEIKLRRIGTLPGAKECAPQYSLASSVLGLHKFT